MTTGAAKWGRGAFGADILRRRPALRTALASGGYFLLGAATGAGKLLGGPGPFAVAAAAASGWGLRGLMCLLGAAAGYMTVSGLFGALRYIAAGFMAYTLGFVTQTLPIRRTAWFMPLTAALTVGLTGALYGGYDAAGVPESVRLFLEVILAGAGTYCFSMVLQRPGAGAEQAQLRRGAGAAMLGAAALMCLVPVTLFGAASVGRSLALIAVMAAGFCGGAMPGCAAGAIVGMCMDMAAGTELFCGAVYPAAALVAGSLCRYGRLTYAVSFCAANAVAALLGWSGGGRIMVLYECFIASVLFMLLPQAALTPVGALLRVGRGKGETAFRLYQAQRLEQMGQGFRRLYASAARQEPERAGRDEAAAVLDRAADEVCRGCAGKEQCWKVDGAGTARSLAPLLETLARKRDLTGEDLPEAFRQRCAMPDAFIGAVNGELRGMMYRRQYRARLREGRAAAYGQFMDMAELLEAAARDLSGTAGPDPAAERRLLRYLKARDLEGTCSVFRDGGGRLHATVEGAGVEALSQEPDYLEKLSQTLGMRLCRIGGGEAGRMVLRQAEPLAVSVGIASMKKEGETVSGDRGTYFKTDGGTLCVILSDGMGTGPDAAEESAAAVEILEGLLKTGVEPGCAMRLLNSAAMLKNGEDWGYATVDLCCIDLFTGLTQFYKYGAAPSYVKTGRAIRRVKGTSLAAGMLAGEGGAPDVVRMRLRPGNLALIASDGVLAENSDQWLRDILASGDGMETKALAKAALRAAAGRFGNADDMTCLAIRVEERR